MIKLLAALALVVTFGVNAHSPAMAQDACQLNPASYTAEMKANVEGVRVVFFTTSAEEVQKIVEFYNSQPGDRFQEGEVDHVVIYQKPGGPLLFAFFKNNCFVTWLLAHPDAYQPGAIAL